jgi:AcrR family transcriptional regulator
MGIAERKEREFRRREAEILGAARRLFDRDDWQLVSIERIAQEAEIGKGTVYLHFPSKEAIYGRLALDFAREVHGRLLAIDPDLPVLERLRQSIEIFFAAHRDKHGAHHVVEYCQLEDFRRRLDDATRAELERVDADITALIHGILQQGIAAGVFADRPMEDLMLGAHATVSGAIRLFGSPGLCAAGIDPDRVVTEVTRFVLAGLMFLDRVPLADAAAPAPAAPARARGTGKRAAKN